MPAVKTVRESAIRLFEPTDDVGVAEVIETAIAARELFGAPPWATISATIMESFVPPAGVRRLTIFADPPTPNLRPAGRVHPAPPPAQRPWEAAILGKQDKRSEAPAIRCG